MQDLFLEGEFTLHSGAKTNWKIECDALTVSDWAALAKMIVSNIEPYGSVVPVPRGGFKLAEALRPYATQGPRLIVDDVLTTGNSMSELKKDETDRGIVLFARGKCPEWVTAVFTTNFT